MFFLSFLAAVEANQGLSPETVGVVVASVVASLGSGGIGAFVMARKTRVVADKDDPLHFSHVERYATRDELEKLASSIERDLRDLRATVSKDTDNIHSRLNSITVLLNKLYGRLEVILELAKPND